MPCHLQPALQGSLLATALFMPVLHVVSGVRLLDALELLVLRFAVGKLGGRAAEGKEMKLTFGSLFAGIGGFGAVFIEAVRASLPADLVPEGKEAQFMGINSFGSLWTQPFVAILGGFLLTFLIDWEYSFTAIMFLLAGFASIIATVLLFFISYEQMVRDEYRRFYKRYLDARGVIEEKLNGILEAII